jgi:plasmid stabilization system protein ParE
MDFQVVFCEPFIEDLERIVRAIAARDPEAAKRLGEEIVRAGESLGSLPERYPMVRERPSIRRLIIKKNFKVFYRVQIEFRRVEILRCWDGRRGANPTIP